jgi:hypothetical protein
LARLKAGNSNAARMAMMAITTSSSTNVKPSANKHRGLRLKDFSCMTDCDRNIVFCSAESDIAQVKLKNGQITLHQLGVKGQANPKGKWEKSLCNS